MPLTGPEKFIQSSVHLFSLYAKNDDKIIKSHEVCVFWSHFSSLPITSPLRPLRLLCLCRDCPTFRSDRWQQSNQIPAMPQ